MKVLGKRYSELGLVLLYRTHIPLIHNRVLGEADCLEMIRYFCIYNIQVQWECLKSSLEKKLQWMGGLEQRIS